MTSTKQEEIENAAFDQLRRHGTVLLSSIGTFLNPGGMFVGQWGDTLPDYATDIKEFSNARGIARYIGHCRRERFIS